MTDPESLRFIGRLIQEWIDWSSQSRARENLPTDGDTAIMSLPVPYWPKHAQMDNWIKAMNDGADEIERLRELLSLAAIECEGCGEPATRVVNGWAYCDDHDGS